ncbi:MAG: hypothetical protein ABGZ24_22765 [Fuerstiella sp.]
MTEPLQQFDWKSSSYERPGDVWVCGKACDGMPCRLGPGADGECSVHSQCQPEQVGDRYRCTRSVLHGGKCADGPNPDGTCCQADESCQPRMSLLKRRKVAGAVCVSISLAICLITFSDSSPQTLLSPGAVTSAHAALEANCAACHVAGEAHSGLLSNAFLAHDSLADSEKCLHCHQDIGAAPLSPHSVDGNALTELTADAAANSNSSVVSRTLTAFIHSGPPDQTRSCATCHQEHHGRSFDLAKLSDQQCQTCHKAQFDDFAHGHPEFEHFPHATRPNIYFDHARHINAYFAANDLPSHIPDKKSLSACSTCHKPDAAGGMMLTVDFQHTCASCHESQIVDLPFPGVPFFAVTQVAEQPRTEPGEIPIYGHWPVTESSLREMPPLMSLLLRGGASGTSTLGITPELIWQCKQLLLKVRNVGETALTERLPEAHSLLHGPLAELGPLLVAVSTSWFPGLRDEMSAHMTNQPLPKSPDVATPEHQAMPPVRGWYISDADRTIRYRPVAHADPVLRRLLDYLVPLVGSETVPKELQELFTALANPSGSGEISRSGPLATGRCLSCHTTSTDDDGILRVNWNTKVPRDHVAFTSFRHEPHMQIEGANLCLTCHQILNDQQTPEFFRPEYFTRDDLGRWKPQPETSCPLSSGFDAIKQSHCASCHNESTASQTCLECHNYHVHSP